MGTWTRERIIRELLICESTGQKLTSSRQHGVDSRLYQAGIRLFGSWRHALLAAGISPARAKLRARWPPEKILERIVALSQRGRPLGPAELRRRHGGMVQAAQRQYGTWAKAVAAAGVELVLLRRVSLWTRDGVIQAILARALQSAPLGSRSVRPRSLAQAGTRLFGSWRAALAAAGVRPSSQAARAGAAGPGASGSTSTAFMSPTERQVRGWTPQSVVDAILARLREHKPLNAKAVYTDERSLHRAATKRFGNWRKALIAAGLNPDQFQKGGGRFCGGP